MDGKPDNGQTDLAEEVKRQEEMIRELTRERDEARERERVEVQAAEVYAKAMERQRDEARAGLRVAEGRLALTVKGVFLLRFSDGWASFVDSDAPDCLRIREVLRELGTYPTAEAALDAAVTALRDAGLMEERHE
jgi:hypothetical protein